MIIRHVFTVILIGWKKFATLLPNYWLAETPEALAPRRLGRQSAERERISEINWNLFSIKHCKQTRFSSSSSAVSRGVQKDLILNHDFKTRLDYFSCFFTVILIGWKKFATLLPNYWLAETPQPLGEEAWQTVGGKGADF
ncbi:hypothetical protein [Peribacillus frigoritolerans]|uniref:hypothetical protein n=1 Tax=Peribacillus frigoritolerans TaxID=450367 RepID=UPI002EA67F46|nr:hypothetical protein [Peribacillus frigoritolerans]